MLRFFTTFAGLMLGAWSLSYGADVALIKMLEEKGYLTQDEAQQIIADDAVRVEPAGKHTKTLFVSTLFQFQYNYIQYDNRGGGNPGTQNNFNLRRVYLGIQGELTNGFGMIIMPNLGDGKVRLDHAYIYKQIKNPDLNLFAGLRKVRFNQEQYSSTGRLRTIERSLVAGFWGNDSGTEDEIQTGSGANGDLGFAAQHMGLFAHYELDDNVSMELSLVNGYSNQLPRNDFQNSLGVYYQLDTEWDFAKDEDEVLSLTAGINTGFQPAGNSFWQPNLTFGGVNRRAGNSDGNASSIGINPYILFNWEDVILTAEFMMNWIDNGSLYNAQQVAANDPTLASDDAVPFGVIVTPSYRFAEDFEIVFRYSYLNTDGRGASITGTTPNTSLGMGERIVFDQAQSFYLGFNWYILRNDLKLQFGYQYTEYWDRYVTNGAEAGNFTGAAYGLNSFRTQLQMVF